MITIQFASAQQAAMFAQEARQSGWRVQNPHAITLVSNRSRLPMALGSVIVLVLMGLIGLLAELGVIGLDRLEPVFAAPPGTVTMLLAVTGAGLGALTGALATLHPASRMPEQAHPIIIVSGTYDRDAVQHLAERHQGAVVEHPQDDQPVTDPPMPMTPLKWLAWGLAVLTGAVVLIATSYIWLLAMDYGHGSDQQTRVGYTLKNVQRIPAGTPGAVGTTLATMFGGTTRPAPADPISAAILAPQAAAQRQTLVYGASGAPNTATEALAIQGLQQLRTSRTVIVIADSDPAYALPAAYAAAQFHAPVIAVSRDGLSPALHRALQGPSGRQFLIAAPARLIPDSALRDMRDAGTVIRAADENIYRHALLWTRSRWGDFGWGMDERRWRDFYGYFTLVNPATPDFAAAGLPMAYQGNYGPLLYTAADDLATVTDQYLWRVSPDYFVAPNEGPFMNVRVCLTRRCVNSTDYCRCSSRDADTGIRSVCGSHDR